MCLKKGDRCIQSWCEYVCVCMYVCMYVCDGVIRRTKQSI